MQALDKALYHDRYKQTQEFVLQQKFSLMWSSDVYVGHITTRQCTVNCIVETDNKR